ncbi:peptidyl-prolyl cis-trans isomerase [Mitsuaria sp. GD03876]|uniref:peptidyl-prolyl cis-trans isomerase n=1 Tax=Mitsuaria sp. GD03876 TaxID=2975399 RepID=UPI002447AAE4|nr:peptidyl-prolyl cis-trans isomerase [Mitsuaria sp. GD03876]MDH0866794.1 peptidyl-prolyl cis-trans isomerase [Mitsuaria sp. GD03876]
MLHFLLLGGVLFGLDHVLASRADDPLLIVVGPEVDAEAAQVFAASRGRAPDAKELAALRQVWLDNEVLYREGLALQLDKGDVAIRERVIFKSLSMIDAGVKLPPADDAHLRGWFESHRDKYDDPARFDFEEAVLPGDADEAALRAFAAKLNGASSGTVSGGGATATTTPPADTGAGLRVFKGRPHANLVQSYGAEFAKSLEGSTLGEWRVFRTVEGGNPAWRAMRLVATTPAKPGDFNVLRGVVLQDWTDATSSEQRSAAVQALSRKYHIRRDGTAAAALSTPAVKDETK